MKQHEIRRTLKTHRAHGYVPLAEIAAQDSQIRQSYNLPPRARRSSLHYTLKRAKIPYLRINASLGVYHKETALARLVDCYSSPMRGNWSCRGAASLAQAHLAATPEILRNPDYLPLRRACQIAGVAPTRVSKWVRYLQILPYWDASGKCLLYSVTELKTLAPWRQYNTIVRHLGHAAAEQIKATRQKKAHRWEGGCLNLYHVPELSHL